jgi:hypothetical protein
MFLAGNSSTLEFLFLKGVQRNYPVINIWKTTNIIRGTVLQKRIQSMQYWTQLMYASCLLICIAEERRIKEVKIQNSVNLHEENSSQNIPREVPNGEDRSPFAVVEQPLWSLINSASCAITYQKKEKKRKISHEFILLQWQQKLTIDVSQSRTRNTDADDGKNATDDVSIVDNNARVSSQLLLYEVSL